MLTEGHIEDYVIYKRIDILDYFIDHYEGRYEKSKHPIITICHYICQHRDTQDVFFWMCKKGLEIQSKFPDLKFS